MHPGEYLWNDLLFDLRAVDPFNKNPKPRIRELLDQNREFAYLNLKKFTNQDFGYDVDKWRRWLEANPEKFQVPDPAPLPDDIQKEMDAAGLGLLDFEKYNI